MFNDAYGLTDAVLSGRKTQTRRIEFDDGSQRLADAADAIGYGQGGCEIWRDGAVVKHIPSRYKVGEVVAVAQSYETLFMEDCQRVADGKPMLNISKPNAADSAGWRNKMYVKADCMPHRIRITDIRVERLQAISDEDCMKEGVGVSATDNIIGYPLGFRFNYYIGEDKRGNRYMLPREAFADLMDKTCGECTWHRNPWVVVYDFKLLA